MQDTTPLKNALEAIGLADLLVPDFIAHERVSTRYREIAAAAARHGYEFRHEHGNVYGKVRLEAISTALAPRLRLATRSDVAAVHEFRRAALRRPPRVHSPKTR